MRLAMIIPTYNGLPHLRTCLPSVMAAARCDDPDTEVIVVDDASTDGTVRWLKEAYPHVRIVARAENGGFAKAANDGLRAARADWVALVNNDVVLDPDWVRSALSREIPPDVGSLATRILWQDRRETIASAGDEYATCGVAIPWLKGCPVSADDRRAECFSACAAAAFYRTAALAKCGLFRESLGAYYEDVDLGFRLNLAGWRCLYVPESTSWHAGGGSYGRDAWNVAYRSARNREIVFWGNMPSGLLLSAAPAHLGAVLFQLLRGVVSGQVIPRGAGTLAGCLRLGEILRIRRQVRRLRSLKPEALKDRLCKHWWRPLLGRHVAGIPGDRGP